MNSSGILKNSCVATIAWLVIASGRIARTSINESSASSHPTILQERRAAGSPPYWDRILRELVFRTISSSSLANNAVYGSLLEAPFYGGPLTDVAKTSSDGSVTSVVVLSRGDVHRLANGSWIFCQEGCVDCEACVRSRDEPTVKWALKRIRRSPSYDSARYELQLTITPQMDETLRGKAPWPRPHVYVIVQPDFDAHRGSNHSESIRLETEVRPVFRNTSTSGNGLTKPTGKEDGSNDETTFVGRMEELRKLQRVANDVVGGPIGKMSSEKDDSEGPSLTKNSSAVAKSDRRVRNSNYKSPVPGLILGTDQRGRKYLVHVVPADHRLMVPHLVTGPATFYRFGAVHSKDERSSTNDDGQSRRIVRIQGAGMSYRRVLRRIIRSLNAHRGNVDSFLREPLQVEKATGAIRVL